MHNLLHRLHLMQNGERCPLDHDSHPEWSGSWQCLEQAGSDAAAASRWKWKAACPGLKREAAQPHSRWQKHRWHGYRGAVQFQTVKLGRPAGADGHDVRGDGVHADRNRTLDRSLHHEMRRQIKATLRGDLHLSNNLAVWRSAVLVPVMRLRPARPVRHRRRMGGGQSHRKLRPVRAWLHRRG